MVRAFAASGSPRLHAELAYHVLDVMLAVEESIASGAPVVVESVPPAITPLPDGWTPTSLS